MGRKRHYEVYAADFETTVYDTQDHTEVWSSALCKLYTEDVIVHHSIDELFEWMYRQDSNIMLYYHNLKFDGSFIIDWLLNHDYKHGVICPNGDQTRAKMLDIDDCPANTFVYNISDRGQWYLIQIKYNRHIVEIRDSLKLMPFSLAKLADAFKLKHKKLTMVYEGERYAGCTITSEELEYIKNDVLVLKEALEYMFEQGHNKLTIGSCCMSEFRKTYDRNDYAALFPDLTEFKVDKNIYGCDNADEYIRRGYRGGWCYYVKGKENKRYHNGLTADVNSLYPSMMHSESGNEYPTGKPVFWHGDYIPEHAIKPHRFFYIRVRCRFYIKDGYLPFIQIKGNPLYKSTEMLETSDIFFEGKPNKYLSMIDGTLISTHVTLTLSQVDYYLFLQHYDVVDFKILDGCWFYAMTGIFDEYINYYRQIKETSTGALRNLAKLFLNNLYGKLASSTISSYKVAYLKEDGVVGFYPVHAEDKDAGYIAAGAAITAYARRFTITAAQKNYHGVDQRGFIYADTDSIHCDLSPEEVNGITVHPTNFCCWKLESYWDTAIFVRQKTYIEHVTHNDGEIVDKPYYDVKCAGLPSKSKELFVHNLEGTMPDRDLTQEEQDFLSTPRTLEDFKVGIRIPDKLLPKRIRGGIVLVNTTYEMH